MKKKPAKSDVEEIKVQKIDLDPFEHDQLAKEFTKPASSKDDLELFDEKTAKIKADLFEVKRLSGKEERWKITKNGKLMFTLEGSKISVKEKKFLNSKEGFLFLLNQSKIGIQSLNDLRKKIKSEIK